MKLSMKYLSLPGAIGGRGGVQRFFMLANDVDFEEELLATGDAWEEEKKRMVESKENPCAGVPVTTIDGKEATFSQHIATCRYLARVNDFDTGDAFKDYIQDLVADEYQGFRNSWVTATFGSDEVKANYRKDLPAILTKFNTLYEKYKTHDVYLSVGKKGNPLWGDSAVFGLLHDNIFTGHMTVEELGPYEDLKSLYESYGAIPAVRAWIESKK